ncbi:response regulator [Candidatus Parcubacteria bacterium]|nr:response regulator [Candidatus Parcubacteria bacterium]
MKKILFIEDERNLQKSFSEFFQSKGFQFFSAFNGEEGLELAKKEKPDLILLDIILPKKDGVSVLKEIKTDPDLKDIPVIILTNLEDIEKVSETMSLGAKAYLVKLENSLFDIWEKVKGLFEEIQ